jgi:hypothetical protein
MSAVNLVKRFRSSRSPRTIRRSIYRLELEMLEGRLVPANLIRTMTLAGTVGGAIPSDYPVLFTWTIEADVIINSAPSYTGNIDLIVDGSQLQSLRLPVPGEVLDPNTGSLSGIFNPQPLRVGFHTFHCHYEGDLNYMASNPDTGGSFTVTANTSISISSSSNPSSLGAPVTFTATVLGTPAGAGTPTSGTVQFMLNGSAANIPLKSVDSAGRATFTATSINFPTVGTYAITAKYNGDGIFNPSSSNTLLQTVAQADVATTTLVTSSAPAPNGSVFGQPVFFTATVLSQTGDIAPTGTVQFTVDGISLGGAITLNNNGNNSVASSPSISTLSEGNHNVQVTYSPTGSFSPSPSPGTLTQPVKQAGTNTSVTSSANPSVFGQSVSFTAIIGVQPPGAGTPSGTVQFLIDDQNFGSPVSVTSGIARSASTLFFVGAHKITASYSGDGNFTGSNGTLASGQVVNPASTSTTVTTSGSPSPFGQNVTFTATIQVQSPGTTAVTNPTGMVTFFDGSTSIGQATLSTSGGVTSASFSSSTLTVATHTITASYAGDGSFTGSSGTIPGGQVVTNPTMIADGTILVLNSPLAGQLAPTGIIGIDPATGAQSLIATSGNFVLPLIMREGPDDQLYVVDSLALGTGAVIAVDPSTGEQRVVATGGNINGPDALAIDNANGVLYAANVGGSAPSLVKIDLSTGLQSLVPLQGNLTNPVSLALTPSGDLYLADEGPQVSSGPRPGAIFIADVHTGVLTPVSLGGVLNHMVDLGLDGNGNLLAFIAGSGGGIIKVDAQGNQTPLVTGLFSADPSLNGLVLDGGTVDIKHGGTIYVSAYDPSGLVHSRVLGIDPNTGAVMSTLAADGMNLSVATGLTVFSTSGGGAAEAPSAASGRGLLAGVSALLCLSQEGRIDLSAAGTSLTSPSVTVAPQNPGVLPPLAAVPSAAVSKAATDSWFKDWDGSLVQEALSADLTDLGMASGHLYS